ncbi:MAG: PKD domain-containing protein, partial [Putridiphycobacter sp.]|nr:PKD domain-containing protein [Putridiphycobacter sp.]
MDKFEKLVKASVESYEAPYSEEAWLAVADKLGPAKGGITKWVILGTVAATIATLGIWYGTQINTVVPKTGENYIVEGQSMTNSDKTATNDMAPELKTSVKHETAVSLEKQTINNNNHSEEESASALSSEKVAQSANKIDNKPLNTPNISTVIKTELSNIEPVDERPISEITESDSEADFSKFKLEAIADKTTVCAGEEVNFSPSIPKLEADYMWDFGSLGTAAGAYTAQKFTKPGDYIVKLNLVNRKTSKVVNASKAITIHVNPIPENEINYEYDNSLIPQVNFSQKNVFYSAIQWEIKGVHTTSEPTFTYAFKNKGNYVVSCEVIGSNGCKSISNTIVNIENNYNLMAPNAFSPN